MIKTDRTPATAAQYSHELMIAGRLIERAEAVLGPLTRGQRVDLLLDNMLMISSKDAVAYVNALMIETAI